LEKQKATWTPLEDDLLASSYFEQVIPSKFYYFKKFGEFTELDFKIVFAMLKGGPDGPRNVSRIAKELRLSQQTVNYRVQRFDTEDLVRFRAVINEPLLGLSNYAVIATVRPGLTYDNKEGTAINAGTFMTCYPIWRLLMAVHGAATHGFFALYSIPPKKESDLRTFFDELKKVKCTMRVDEFCKVTQSYYNTPPLESYLEMREAIARNQPVSFDWEKWGCDFDEAAEAVMPEERAEVQVPFTYEDLLIIFYLEKNLRERFVDMTKSVGESSSKIARRYEELLKCRLIIGCRAEIYPVNPATSMYFTLKLDFVNGVALRKFVSHLDKVPYPVAYQKVIGEETIFLHVIIPSYEHFEFYNVFELLNRRQEIISNVNLYVSNYLSKLDNIALYQAFSRDKKEWAFSKDTVFRALHKLIDDTRFKF